MSVDNNHLSHEIKLPTGAVRTQAGGHRGTADGATFAPFFYHLVVIGAALDAHNCHARPFMAIGAWLRGQFFTISCVAAFIVTVTCLAGRCSPWSVALPSVAWFFCEMISHLLVDLPLTLGCALLSLLIYFPGQFLFNLLQYVPLRYVWLTASLGVVVHNWFRNKWTWQRYACVVYAALANYVVAYFSISLGMFFFRSVVFIMHLYLMRLYLSNRLRQASWHCRAQFYYYF